jgi:hypothetical protein
MELIVKPRIENGLYYYPTFLTNVGFFFTENLAMGRTHW